MVARYYKPTLVSPRIASTMKQSSQKRGGVRRSRAKERKQDENGGTASTPKIFAGQQRADLLFLV